MQMPKGTPMYCKCGSDKVKITPETITCKSCGASGPNEWKPKGAAK